jgi:hypothetical protein
MMMKNNKKRDTNQKKNTSDDENLDMNQQTDPNLSKDANDLESKLDEIKKLASDYTDDEKPDFEAEANQIETAPDQDNSLENDYLDRLNDLSIEKDYVSVIASDKNITTRLDKIKIDQEISDKNNNVEISKKAQTEISALPSPAVDPKKKPTVIIKKKSISIDHIEKEADTMMEQNRMNEDFVNRTQSSLNEDEQIFSPISKSESENVFKTFDEDLDDKEIIQEIEQEILNAEKAVNPFLEEIDSETSDDFLTNLDKITIPEEELAKIKDKNQIDELSESELMLSSSSWKDLLESMDDDGLTESQKVFNFEEPQPFENFLHEISSPGSEEKTTVPMLGDGLETEQDMQFDDEDFAFISSLKNDEMNAEEDESVESLRKSFNEEFDQSAFDEETEKRIQKKWLPRKIEVFNNWVKSLSLAEKILIFLSFIVSLAVIVSIILVVTQWNIKNDGVASPPPAIEAIDQDIIYPTGLQLPGGWFFFLQRGEIQDNKWEPQNAEWLANTKLRKVIAIPWSNQSEAVIQSLTPEDEISIFMNNNDVIVYQVENVLQIPRDNVRILSDTEPSLVVILFREDNEDRWTIIAIPKSIE